MKEIKEVNDKSLQKGDVVRATCKYCKENRLFSVFALNQNVIGKCSKCKKVYAIAENKNFIQPFSQVKTHTQPTKPVVQCPYCKSTNTKKITVTSKAVHTAIFGLFSISRNVKQWKCSDCGSEF